MASHRIRAARTSERVELVDEDDRRGALVRLLEQIAHACCADADEHLDELGAVDREERYAGFAGDRACEQRLAGTWRPDEQNALRNAPAEPAVARRILEKSDDFAKLFFGFVDARDIRERRLGVGLDVDLCLALADREQSAHATLLGHPARQEHPDQIKDERGQHPRQHVAKERILDRTGVFDVVLRKLLREIRLDTDRDEAVASIRDRLLVRSLNRIF